MISMQPRSERLGWIDVAVEALSRKEALQVFRQASFNRYFELEVARASEAKRIKAPIYLSVGQEHIPATIAAVSKDFAIFGQHRAHSYYLSFGGNPAALVDELLHKETGCARGMGGSASIHSPAIRMFGHSGLMGDQLPIAVGYALVGGRQTLAVAGDGAAEEDYVLGAIGFAASKKAPLLFVCEDNDLSILTKVSTRRKWSLVEVARSFGFAGADITDDPWLIAYHVRQALQQLPYILNIRTCRHLWHAGTGRDGDPEWNRYELFKAGLREMGESAAVDELESLSRSEAEQLWA